MESTDFIQVAHSHCPQEGSWCWVEGQVLPEKLLLLISPGPLASLLSQGWWWLAVLHKVAAREACSGCLAPLWEHSSQGEGTWEIGMAPYLFRCPWVAVRERGGLALWARGATCPAAQGSTRAVNRGVAGMASLCWGRRGGEVSSLLWDPVAELRAVLLAASPFSFLIE